MTTAIDDAELPADARTLLESRGAPLAGGLIVTTTLLVCGLFGWMAWAEVEEVVRAGGRIEPAGHVKIINHPRGGRVAEILVRDGDRVGAGAPLVRLDPESSAAEHAELLGRHQVRAVEVARLEAEAAFRPLAVDPKLAAARPDLVAAARGLIAARADAFAARREALAKAVQTRKGELKTTAAELGRVRNGLTIQRQQLQAVRELAERGLYPKLKLVAVEKQTADAEGELAKTEASLSAAQAALAESEARLAALEKERQSEILRELGEARAERDRLAEQIAGRDTQLAGLVVKAPVAGIVQNLGVAATGQAVGANEPIMKLVPLTEGLVVEARVANQDIGRLRPGLPAKVKVQAFDFVRHGTLTGKVARIAADATPDARTGDLLYAVTVVTDRSHLGERPGEREVAPGMVVEVELTVGERTILSYLTDRIWQIRDGAFREG